MSYYYNYYLGKREIETGMVYPTAPMTEDGKMMFLRSVSRSFASDLWDDMYCLPENKMSDELKSQFSYKDWNGEDAIEQIRILPLTELQVTEPFETAYVPIFDITDKRADDEDWFFTDKLSPEQYAAFCLGYAADSLNVRKVERYDLDTGDYAVIELKPTDYMYYRWIDKTSKTYEAWLLSTMVHNLDDLAWRAPKGFEWVVLETEG